jgi:hypothetical protein
LNPLGLADLRALAASVILYYLTGLPLARRLSRGAGGPAFTLAMPCSLAVLMGALFLARLAGLGLSAATAVIALTVLAAVLGPLVLDWRDRRDGIAAPVEKVPPLEWGLIGASVLVLLAAGGPLGMIQDSFDHLAAIRRSVLGDAILPADIVYRGGDGIGWDPRKGFLHPLHAFTCRLAHVDPLHLWRVLPAVFAPGVLLAVCRFLRSWTGPGRRGDLSLLAWVLVGSGSGFLWLLRAGYPNHVAYPLSFLAIALAIDYVLGRDTSSADSPARDQRAQLVAIAMLAFAGALIHLVASLLLLAGLGFLGAAVLFSDPAKPPDRPGGAPRDARVGRVIGAGVAAVAGLAAPTIFRLLTQGRADSTLHTHAQGLFFLGGGLLLASPSFVFWEVGFAGLLGLLVLPFAARGVPSSRRLAFVIFTAGPWICVWTPLFTPLHRFLGYLTTRLLELLPTGAVLVLAGEEAWRRLAAGRRRTPLGLVTAGVVLGLVLLTAGRAAVSLPAEFRRGVYDATGAEVPSYSTGAFAFIRQVVEASPSRPPVVLADPFTSYALGGTTGAHLVTTLNQHGSPVDRRWRARLDDQREMLLGTVDAARVDSLLGAYQVDLVFVNSALSMPTVDFGYRLESSSMERARRQIEEHPDRFPVLYRGPDGIVTAVRPGGAAGHAGGAGDAGVSEAAEDSGAAGAVVASAGPFSWGAISATNVTLPARPLERGESLRIPLSWVRTGVVAGDLPLVAHLRMRTAVPPRWFARPAWSKPARLLAQQLDDRLYRFSIGRPPFEGERNPARLPLNIPVPDTLRIIIPPRAAPGLYDVTLALVEEPLLANVSLHDLLRDDDGYEGPVVGRVIIR